MGKYYSTNKILVAQVNNMQLVTWTVLKIIALSM